MLQAIKIAIIAAFAHTVEGHVRALPTGPNGFGCRECNGKASPGPFRVNGALGGNKAFGANGVAKVTPNQEIELSIAYNGGHQGPNNLFYVRYACGAATGNANNFNNGCAGKTCTQLTANQITSVDGQAANNNNYPIDARQSKRSGYTIKFNMPAIQGTKEQRSCTFALVEGRNWGMGWDFEIQAANEPTPAPTPPPAPKSIQGTYTLNEAGCQKDAPNCVCLQGKIVVKHTAGAQTATALLDITNYPKHEITLKEKVKGAGAWSADGGYVLANCGPQPDNDLDINIAVDQQAASGGLLNIGVITANPTVCGTITKTSSQNNNYAKPPPIPNQCAGCQDVAGWKDKDGETCSAYNSCLNGAWRTKGLDHYKKYVDNQGKTARDGCCQCGGGQKQVATTKPDNGGGNIGGGNTGGGNTGGGNTGGGNTGGGNTGGGNTGGGNNGGTTRRSMFGNAAVAAADDAQTIAIAFGTLLTVCTAMLI